MRSIGFLLVMELVIDVIKQATNNTFTFLILFAILIFGKPSLLVIKKRIYSINSIDI